ncbi:O-antigen ligase family protein [Zavarzinia sp. CC-PAN008]|uniref:O-antigen ligase family protein n=1 Tax=Zavarzinia sp. CC-PAN008 TaxID=3243332 RepID=UPI003F744FEE
MRPLLWASLAAIFAGLVLGQGRGPVLAVLAGVLVLLAVQRRWRMLAGAAALALAGAAALALLAPEVLFRASADIRLDIWQAYGALIAERPWTGHGVGDLTRVVVPAAFAGLGAYGPHSLFVGVAFHGGLVGLGLFGTLLGVAAWTAWRRHPPALALVAFVVVNGAVDFGRMVEPLGPAWFVLWLPLGAVLGVALSAPGARPAHA